MTKALEPKAKSKPQPLVKHGLNGGGPIAVLGAGAWGGTLAWLLSSESGKEVRLYRRPGPRFDELVETRELTDPVKIKLDPTLKIVSSLEEALDKVSIVILACTSQTMSELAADVSSCLVSMGVTEPPLLVSVVKGLEAKTLKRMSEAVCEKIESAKVLCLSGPNLAFEIRNGLPTASVVAYPELEVARAVQSALSTKTFRLYATDDLIGVELGGTLKNIMAIAAGASDGLKLGVNAKSALLTRGLAEMVRLSIHFGARPSTLFGLSGMGDLIATCEGPLSRNYRVGMYLAQNLSLPETIEKVGAVAEGVITTRAVCELSKNLDIDLPIAKQVQSTLDGMITPRDSIMALMGRPLSTE